MNNNERVTSDANGLGRLQPPPVFQAFQQPCTISVSDFCQMSGLKKTTAYKLIRTNKIASTLVGRRRLISLESAKALIVPNLDANES
jgi:excisionase family DNA binding protein